MALAGAILMLIGSLVFLVSSLGLTRMPDMYNRIQTGTKATTLGTILVLTGVGILHPAWFPKMVVILVFILLTNPISSHVVARAAHFIDEKTTDKTIVDKLQKKSEEGNS
ncbi:monovalent cation/H(+) antiporter subunit G [bacterium]|nr:monovalent cation/H(+) antiporter subunit G [bacterium]